MGCASVVVREDSFYLARRPPVLLLVPYVEAVCSSPPSDKVPEFIDPEEVHLDLRLRN